MLSQSKRVVLLAACALAAASCSEEATTAPLASADVIAEGAELPTTYGSEYGTITFTSIRGDATACEVKIALRGLYTDPDDTDFYYLYVGETGTPPNMVWYRQIYNAEVARAAFRGEGTISKAYLQPPNTYDLRLAFRWNGTYQYDHQLGYFTIGGYARLDPDFKVVNRCF